MKSTRWYSKRDAKRNQPSNTTSRAQHHITKQICSAERTQHNTKHTKRTSTQRTGTPGQAPTQTRAAHHQHAAAAAMSSATLRQSPVTLFKKFPANLTHDRETAVIAREICQQPARPPPGPDSARGAHSRSHEQIASTRVESWLSEACSA